MPPQQVIEQLLQLKTLNEKTYNKVVRRMPKEPGSIYKKAELLAAAKAMPSNDEAIESLIKFLTMKPMRTQSGVATVTVLTKPFPCPGKCIFCPNDIRMPKSYLSDEPGAQRAERNMFDPYLQVYNRLQALQNIGHPTGKVELIILGGTWSYYPKTYQIWFVKRCFDAMNEFGVHDGRLDVHTNNVFVDVADKVTKVKEDGKRKTYNQIISEIRWKHGQFDKDKQEIATWDELYQAHVVNENAQSRCVGLVIETRPDDITIDETHKLRQLGCTKIQLGIQTLNDAVNDANKRGHHAIHVAQAFELLRGSAGFKLHGHMMPNLYTATPESDLQDFHDLFEIEQFRPDELKIYPTSVIADTELYDLWNNGSYQPYERETLIDLIAEMMVHTPNYCRLTRVIRDIPSTDIVAGNKTTNLREVVQQKLISQGRKSNDIRWREIKQRNVTWDELELVIHPYETASTKELFLSYQTKDDGKIAGFLRLSLPQHNKTDVFEELRGCAMIREVHVYGQMLNVGDAATGKAQHLGLGGKLIDTAKQIAKQEKYQQLAVISAIGTREYYRKHNFELKKFYQVCDLN